MNGFRLAFSFVRYRAPAIKEALLALPLFGVLTDQIFDLRKARHVRERGILFVHIPKMPAPP